MSLSRVTPLATKLPSMIEIIIFVRLSPFAIAEGLIETEEYIGVEGVGVSVCSSARLGVALNKPKVTGRAIASAAATVSRSLRAKPRLCKMRSFIIWTILFLRSAPVTPETQGNGDPRQNSQTFKMLSA